MSNFIECSRQYKNHWEKGKGGKRQNLKYYKDRQGNRKKKNLVIDSDQWIYNIWRDYIFNRGGTLTGDS